ncbi:hypothetical protein C8J56DRAFT_932718 [Mycena floridula]|nr:hypothetical protein C8J56DRAFT_932718 [Mycena floridula]
MSHTSPATFLVWALMSSLLLAFLVFHLWSFDKFRCLRWDNGPYSGAFKRVMTYSYLTSVPLILAYSVGFSVIKYREGYFDHPLMGIIPKPYQLWDQASKAAIFPFTLAFSFAWSLEMVTHLEELCFWLFLVNAGSAQQDWFRSFYFRTWVIGSLVAVLYMPLVTIFTRSDPLKSEAYTFLAGSLGSFSLTLWFTPILWTFPSFLDSLRRENVDAGTIVRLTKFHELNTIRVVFRFLFVCPFIVLGVDGVRPHPHVNENPFWTDVLTIGAAFGCVVSSGITLIIFFPRSIEGEIAAKDAKREKRRNRSLGLGTSMLETQHQSNYSQSFIDNPTYLLTSSPVKHQFSLPSNSIQEDAMSEIPVFPPSPYNQRYRGYEEDSLTSEMPTKLVPIRPNRRVGDDVELGGMSRLTETNVSQHNISLSHIPRPSKVNPFVHNFTSPLDVGNVQNNSNEYVNGSRLTFNRR